MSSSGSGGGRAGPPFFSIIDGFVHGMHKDHGVHWPFWPFIIAFAIENFLFLVFAPVQTFHNFSFTFFISPLWVPLLVWRGAWDRHIDAIQFSYSTKMKKVLLEIRLPREVHKSPVSMETFFTNMNIGPGEGTWWKKYVWGRTRPWWSFELMSIEGRVHFCVWTREQTRRAVETYLYSQYPGVEIVEIPDQLRFVDLHAPNTRAWSCEYKFKWPDPCPIKTYVDFGLDKPGIKPEEQVDPLSQVIEFMGSLGKGERAWLQIIIRLSKGEKYGKRKPDGSRFTWKDEANEMIDKIRDSATPENEWVDPTTGQIKKSKGFPNLTKPQVEDIATLDRTTSRSPFDVGLRSFYVADKDHYFEFIGPHLSQIWKPFSGWNVIEPAAHSGSEKFNDFPWEDPTGHHYMHEMERMLDRARRRAYFHYPYKGPNMIMNAEELATMYHIPSSSTITPNLPRIQSTSTEAPANLPT